MDVPERSEDKTRAAVSHSIGEDTTGQQRSEEKLRRLERILSSTADMLALVNRRFVYLAVNRAYLQAHGKTTAEVVGRTMADLMGEEFFTTVIRPRAESCLAGEVIRWEKWIEFPSAGRKYMEIEYSPYVGSADDVHGFVVSARDITKWKQAEEERERLFVEVRQSEQKFRTIFEKAPLGISLVDSLTGENYEVNPRFAEIVGRSREELATLDWMSITHPDDLQENLGLMELLNAGEIPGFSMNKRYQRPDGSIVWISITIAPVSIANTSGPSHLCMFEDISDRKRAEEENERLSMAIDQMAEAVLITDALGTIQYVNPAFERITGYSREEAVGRNPRILKSGEQDDAFYLRMWKSLLAGEAWSDRFINKRKDGSLYTEEAVISPLHDSKGRTVNYVAVKRDITEELELEREKKKLEMQYHQAQKIESLGRLVGGVAHDLNNLLTPILGFAEVLRDDLDSDDRRQESVDEVVRAGIRAKDLVRRLLAFSRRQTLEYQLVDMSEVVTGFQSLLRRTIRSDIEVEIVASPDVPMVKADVGQIEQVIMNLVINAQDAMPEGGRLILETGLVELDESYTARHQGVEPGAFVMLAVSDTGCGMEDDTREHLFEPFFSTKGELGTGLGLATVHGIVKQHGGSIWAYSEPGEGSTFKIYLPFAEAPVVEEKAPEEAAGDLGGSETILLADDDEQVRHLARTVLERQGYRVLEAESGADALKLLASHDAEVHLLLTDLVMPGMNGVELYAQAKADHPGLKVLYMSGYSAATLGQDVIDDSTTFIQKPFAVRGLATQLREILNRD